MRSCISAAAFLAAAATVSHAQSDIDSAGYALNGCRLLSEETLDGMFEQTRCAEKIKSIFRTRNSMANCTPRRSNIKENAATVVSYIEARKDRWHEKFTILAQEALTQDWPCNK